MVLDIILASDFLALNGGALKRLFHFCGVMGKIFDCHLFLVLLREGWRSGFRLETKSTARHCNYSLWHWLIGK